MRFDIIGAGSLGLLFGGKLSLAGHVVTFWTRTRAQADSLKEQGIIVEEHGARIIVPPQKYHVYAVEDATRIVQVSPDWAAPDWLMLMTKQRALDDQLMDVADLIRSDATRLLCFQNGVGHLDYISRSLGTREIYAAITTEGAKRKDIWHVVRSGEGVTRIGSPVISSANRVMNDSTAVCADGGDEGISKLISALKRAGFCALLSKDIDREIYRKLLVNSVINPLTALWRIRNGELLESEQRLTLLKQLCDEAEAVFRASGIDIDEDPYELVKEVCHSTAANVSSMLADTLQGVPTEVDYINGRLVEMAYKVKVPVPGHETIWQLVRGLCKL